MTATGWRATLEALAVVAPPIITSYAKPGPHCVLSTAIGQQVLDAYGIPSQPWSVEVMVCNDAWVQWGYDCDFSGGVEEQGRRGAYMLSNSPDWSGDTIPMQGPQPDKAWDGHLVLRVSQPNAPLMLPYLVDLDLGSFNRPAQQIDVPGGLVVPIRKPIVEGTVQKRGGPRTHVAYRPMVSAFADDYRSAGDWVKRDRYLGIVVEILDAMKARKSRSA